MKSKKTLAKGNKFSKRNTPKKRSYFLQILLINLIQKVIERKVILRKLVSVKVMININRTTNLIESNIFLKSSSENLKKISYIKTKMIITDNCLEIFESIP